MESKINRYLTLLPIAGILMYIFGYMSLNAYLQSYGIDEPIGLDTNVLRHGILFSVVCCISVGTSFAGFKLGHYPSSEEENKTTMSTLFDAYGYTIMYTLALSYVFWGFQADLPTVLLIIIFGIFFIVNRFNQTNFICCLKSVLLVVAIIIMIAALTLTMKTGKYQVYLLQQIIFLPCITFRMFTKKDTTYQVSKLSQVIITVALSTYFFGAFIVKDIPKKFGGESGQVQLYYFDSTSLVKIKRTDLIHSVKGKDSVLLKAIYKTTNKIYFQTNNKTVVGIPPSYIESEISSMP